MDTNLPGRVFQCQKHVLMDSRKKPLGYSNASFIVTEVSSHLHQWPNHDMRRQLYRTTLSRLEEPKPLPSEATGKQRSNEILVLRSQQGHCATDLAHEWPLKAMLSYADTHFSWKIINSQVFKCFLF